MYFAFLFWAVGGVILGATVGGMRSASRTHARKGVVVGVLSHGIAGLVGIVLNTLIAIFIATLEICSPPLKFETPNCDDILIFGGMTMVMLAFQGIALVFTVFFTRGPFRLNP